MSANYVYMAGNGFVPDPKEPVLRSIFREYERVLVESLVTSFGLDMFIHDQHGGDVDTIHNVRQIGKDERMTYKNKQNAADYAARGEYKSSDYHGDKRYIQKNKEISQQKEAGTLIDAYTGKKIQANEKHNLDHVISANEIHNDPGRTLAGVDGREIANSEDNLRATNERTNKQKSSSSMDDFLERRGDEYTEEEKARMRKIDEEARKSYDAKLNKAYYTSPKFAKDMALAAGTRGVQMGVRQALGFVFAEMWFAVKAEFNQSEDSIHFDLAEFFWSLGRGLKKGFENAKEKYKELFSKFFSGATAGVLSSLTTTLCNIFFTTAKNVVRVIRQSYASLVEAAKVLFINPQNYTFGERMRAVAKILATGASVVVGTLVSEAIANTPIGVIPTIGAIVQSFCGAFVTGIMSCTLLYFLDRSEIINKLVQALDSIQTMESSIAYYRRQAEYFEAYAAKLMEIDLKAFRRETTMYSAAVSGIESAKTEAELSNILLDIYEAIGIRIPWEGFDSLDSFMNDPDATLIFG